MKTVTLGELAAFVRGVTFKPTDVTGDGVGLMRTKNVQESLDLGDVVRIPAKLVKNGQYLQPGDTLISSANSWNLVGKACWIGELTEPLAIGGFVTALRPDASRVEPRYLYRWFTSPLTQALLRSFSNKTTSISNLNLKLSAQMPVPVPPREAQRRIAGILDQADAIRTKHRRVLAQFDILIQSIFHDMFGDPDGALKTVPFSEVSGLSGGRNLVADDSGSGSSYRVLKISAVTTGRFNPAESKPLPLGYEPPGEHLVRRGDLLMSRANTAELVGSVAYVHETPPNLALPDKVWRFDWRVADSVPAFYHALFWTASIRRRIGRLSSGTSGSMKNISKAKLGPMPLPRVPVVEQRAFADRIDLVNTQRALAQRALDANNELFASLQVRAFRGEL